MKKINKIYIPIALISIAMIFMSYKPFKNNFNNSKNIAMPTTNSCSIHVGWKEVNVNYNTSGKYYVLYSDIVDLSNIDPDHTMMWGCGYLDLTTLTTSWDCTDIEQWFSAYGSENCAYIYIQSNSVPDPQHPVATHTINVKVRDDHGDASNFGGITFKIHYVPNPDNSEPMSPCGGAY